MCLSNLQLVSMRTRSSFPAALRASSACVIVAIGTEPYMEY